jgi:hypothetical protein
MRHLLAMLVLVVITSLMVYAQKDTVDVPDTYDMGGQEGTLNDAIQPRIDNGTVSNTVFRLKLYGLYVLTGTITTKPGQVLEIVAPTPGTTQQTAPPMIAWTASTAPDKSYIFDVPGEVRMKNVWLLYGTTGGTQVGSSLRVGDSATVSGGRCRFENVIFDWSPCPQTGASGAVNIYATHFKGTFENCYFKNCIDSHLRYYGRALSFNYSSTGLHADSVLFENCTFANMGYVYMQEGQEYGDNVQFNHCTFYDVVVFSLEQGWWYKMSVTNSLFINTYMFGRTPANDGEGFGGTINIAPIDSGVYGGGFGFAPPFTEQDRRILFANNNYYIDQWLVDWMGPHGNPYSDSLHRARADDMIPTPQPMINSRTRAFFDTTDAQGNKLFPYMNKANLDSLNPGFVNPPLNLDSLKKFIWYKWSSNADCNWAWKPENDYQNQLWPVEEDMSYTDGTLKTAGMGGFPLGDLYRWWPTQYAQWKAQADAEHSRITTWLENGHDPLSGVREVVGGTVPSRFTLAQNYPNPFNPTTEIKYSVPKQAFVSLKVYNTLGEAVRTLFEGQQGPGNYVATFDATGLASGAYFYRLESGSVSITKKLVLVK